MYCSRCAKKITYPIELLNCKCLACLSTERKTQRVVIKKKIDKRFAKFLETYKGIEDGILRKNSKRKRIMGTDQAKNPTESGYIN